MIDYRENKQIIDSLKSTIKDSLEPLIDSDCILTDLPYHGNIGDILIWQGELDFLKEIHRSPNHQSSHYTFSFPKLDKNIIILLHGGGNFGDLYSASQDFRKKILKAYPENRIIMLPQSVWYNDSSLIEKDAVEFSRHSKLTLCARDIPSYNFLKDHFSSNNILLLPDMAFCLSEDLYNKYLNAKANKKVLIKRLDKELSNNCPQDFSNLPITEIRDWPTFEKNSVISTLLIYTAAIMRKIKPCAFKRLICRQIDRLITFRLRPHLINSGLRFLSEYSVIYTTRLHCLILGFLINRRVYYINNVTKKLSAFTDSWLKAAKSISPVNTAK